LRLTRKNERTDVGWYGFLSAARTNGLAANSATIAEVNPKPMMAEVKHKQQQETMIAFVAHKSRATTLTYDMWL
jgi:hypothetical protein